MKILNMRQIDAMYEFRDTLQLLDMRGKGVSHALIESYLLRYNISGLKK